jgi:hypothetical protein
MTDKEVMQMALDVLTNKRYAPSIIDTTEALRAALAQPEPEPVGRFAKFSDGIWKEVTDGSAGQPLYTAPPQRKEWVGLTDGDKQAIFEACYDEELDFFSNDSALSMAEAKLKDKNGY